LPKIFVVAHIKPDLHLPAGYEYIGVGSKDLEFQFSDKSGESIAELNPYFSELTALYWIWKNYECEPDDVVGLVHYRRLLVDAGLFPLALKKPVSTTKIKYLLQKYDLIVPESQNLRPNAYHNYGREHTQEDLDFVLTMAEINDSVPPGTYKNVLINMDSNRMCNVFITRKHLLDRYCSWLFPILFDAYKEIDMSGRNSYQQRAFGFLSERLFNVWLVKEKQLKSTSLPMIRLDFPAFKNWNRRRLNNR
jgi:hypothetical protein